MRAAVLAHALARRLDARPSLVNVAPLRLPERPRSTPSLALRRSRDLAEAEAAHLFAELDGAAEGMARRVELGDPATVLGRLALEQDALAIVAGRRGRSSTRAALLGTVSGQLAASAPVPVVVVPEAAPPSGGGGIVCGVDGSAHARRAAVAAARFAARLDTRLTLVAADDVARAGPWEAVLADAAGAVAAAADVEVAVAGVTGDAAHQLACIAAERGADLVAVGARGRGPWRAAILGSVSSCLMRLAPCPVLVVPPAAGQRAAAGASAAR